MRKYLGKCNGLVGEIAVVGVKTRARAALTMAAATTTTTTAAAATTSSPSKKIKKTTSSSYNFNYQLRNRRTNLSVPENFVIQIDSTAAMTTAAEEQDEIANCSSSEVITCTTTTTSSDYPPSCCSSNENENDGQLSKSNVIKDRCIVDLEVENGEASSRYIDCHRTTTEEKEEARNEATKSNGHDSSSPSPKLPDSKSTVQIKMMPSDSEIEEFFSAAEKDLHKRFIDKYNFDIVKDVPLEGRYEWVQINP